MSEHIVKECLSEVLDTIKVSPLRVDDVLTIKYAYIVQIHYSENHPDAIDKGNVELFLSLDRGLPIHIRESVCLDEEDYVETITDLKVEDLPPEEEELIPKPGEYGYLGSYGEDQVKNKIILEESAVDKAERELYEMEDFLYRKKDGSYNSYQEYLSQIDSLIAQNLATFGSEKITLSFEIGMWCVTILKERLQK